MACRRWQAAADGGEIQRQECDAQHSTPQARWRTTPTIPPFLLMMSVVKGRHLGQREKEEASRVKDFCYLWGEWVRGGGQEGQEGGGWVGEGESSREVGEGEVEIRTWSMAMRGGTRSMGGGDANEKTPRGRWHSLKSRLWDGSKEMTNTPPSPDDDKVPLCNAPGNDSNDNFIHIFSGWIKLRNETRRGEYNSKWLCHSWLNKS